jgi:hypothetical protein
VRERIDVHGEAFRDMVRIVEEEAFLTNPRLLCATCWSLETRDSREKHDVEPGCVLFTAKLFASRHND